MKKAELIAIMAREASISKRAAALTLNALLKIIGERLAAGEEVILPGFGIFSVVERKERVGRNPRTGEPVPIPACLVVRFRPGQNLKRAVSEA